MTEKPDEPAQKPVGVEKPNDWDKVVSVAYLRAIGHTQQESADGAGCSVRAVIEWEKSAWWPRAQAEANRRWLNGVEAFARRGILSALVDQGEYAQMARYIADRAIPEMKPPKVRKEHSGPGGKPIEVAPTPLDLSNLSDDELAAYKRLTAKAIGDDSGD